MLRIFLLIAILLVFSSCQISKKESVALVALKQTNINQSKVSQKICLNMIVKNESHVIRRCLDSVMPLIDSWIIVDTGSDDGTPDIIRDYLKDIPGRLYTRAWKNFGHNRNEALKLAQEFCQQGHGDYILFMDADDVLEFEQGFQSLILEKDLYNMWRGSKWFTYQKPQIVKAGLPWKWIDDTHEYLDCESLYSSDILDKIKYITMDDGATRTQDPRKFLKNIEIFTKALEKNPGNHRHTFYLAESYYDAGQKGHALEWYQKRVQLGGWEEEVFWAKFRIAQILRELSFPLSVVIESYKDTHECRPHRVEPIYALAEIYNQQQNYRAAYDLIKTYDAISKPAQKDALFNADWMSKFGLLFQLSICSYYVGEYEESLAASNTLLKISDLPEEHRKLAESNRIFPLEKLKISP